MHCHAYGLVSHVLERSGLLLFLESSSGLPSRIRTSTFSGGQWSRAEGGGRASGDYALARQSKSMRAFEVVVAIDARRGRAQARGPEAEGDCRLGLVDVQWQGAQPYTRVENTLPSGAGGLDLCCKWGNARTSLIHLLSMTG